jgi:hypothetical protein
MTLKKLWEKLRRFLKKIGDAYLEYYQKYGEHYNSKVF